MLKLLPLLVLLAAPAGAQEPRVYRASTTWPVEIAGRTCSLVNAAASAASNPLMLSYDATSGEVTLTIETTDFKGGLDAAGALRLSMVFLDNGPIKHDDGWDPRTFGYTHQDGVTRLTTRFAGERPVRQILADLAGSRHIGLLYQGEVVASTDLAGAARSIESLRSCARQALAAN